MWEGRAAQKKSVSSVGLRAKGWLCDWNAEHTISDLCVSGVSKWEPV